MERIIGSALAAVASIASIGASQTAGAHHTFTAEHAPRAIAVHGQAHTIDVPVASSCAIAHCGWIQGKLTYVTSDQVSHQIITEVPYQPTAILSFAIPEHHVVAEGSYAPIATIRYHITISQWDCLGECHVARVELPRLGAHYTLMVVDA